MTKAYRLSWLLLLLLSIERASCQQLVVQQQDGKRVVFEKAEMEALPRAMVTTAGPDAPVKFEGVDLKCPPGKSRRIFRGIPERKTPRVLPARGSGGWLPGSDRATRTRPSIRWQGSIVGFRAGRESVGRQGGSLPASDSQREKDGPLGPAGDSVKNHRRAVARISPSESSLQ